MPFKRICVALKLNFRGKNQLLVLIYLLTNTQFLLVTILISNQLYWFWKSRFTNKFFYYITNIIHMLKFFSHLHCWVLYAQYIAFTVFCYLSKQTHSPQENSVPCHLCSNFEENAIVKWDRPVKPSLCPLFNRPNPPHSLCPLFYLSV